MAPAELRLALVYAAVMEIVNHYSLAILAVVVFAAIAFLLRRRRRIRFWVLGLTAVGLLLGYLALRPTATPAGDSVALGDEIGAGIPVLLELQSPF